MEVVFYKGAFIGRDSVFLSSESRSFNYGDGFFETIKVINKRVFNFPYHMQRIKLAFSILKLNYNYTEKFWHEIIYELITVNKMISGTIKIHVSRSGAGKYLPDSCDTDLFVRSINGSLYQKNNMISLCFYEDESKTRGSLSNIKSVSSLVSVLALVYANENSFDNAILVNSSGNVIEASNANLFIVKNNKICTPPISEGCVDGTMRKWVVNKLDVYEKVILRNDILEADAVFVTNATSGLIAVKTVEKKSFSDFSVVDSIQKDLISLSLDL